MSEVKSREGARRRFRAARWALLLAVLAISTVIGLLHQKAPELRLVGADALCPFGGVESLWAVLASGTMLKKIAAGSFILLGAAVGLNLLLGRSFCGSFCALGALQDVFGWVRKKLGMRRMVVPAALDVPARFLKYLIFGVFAWLSWLTGSLAIRPYDPWVAYHHLISPELLTNFGIGAAVLGVSLAGSFLYERFFCKYLCPMGAFLGLFSRLGLYRVTRHADACIDCGACDRVCPANIAVSVAPGVVSDSECLACGECVAVCPREPALRFESPKGASVTPSAVVGLTGAIMAAVVGLSVAAGAMDLRVPSLADQAGAAGTRATYSGESTRATTGTTSGATFDPALIKGYMTFSELSEGTGIAREEFVSAFGLREGELEVPLKEMKYTHDFDTQAVRDWVADRLGVARSAPESCE